MTYQRNFIKELTYTAIGIFIVLLAILVSTQAINLLGRAASGRVRVSPPPAVSAASLSSKRSMPSVRKQIPRHGRRGCFSEPCFQGGCRSTVFPIFPRGKREGRGRTTGSRSETLMGQRTNPFAIQAG